jgi:hypothetical protein
VYGDGEASISASVPFLDNYLASYSTATPRQIDLKGNPVKKKKI